MLKRGEISNIMQTVLIILLVLLSLGLFIFFVMEGVINLVQ
jgi:hypothetical protein